jgi:carbon-monoxide dehydrogenase medium subunit
VIPQAFEYMAPATLEEALDLAGGDGVKLLAGGMSLVPLMKLRLATPALVVDLGRIGELRYIREDGGRIRIGAMTTHWEIESSPLVRAKCPLLAETAAVIGDVQVRNLGTLGGSIVHADPAADYPAALCALEARVRLRSRAGERTLTIGEFLLDIFTTAIEPGEILTEVEVPVEEAGTAVSYQKMAHPASGFAVVGAAVRLRRTNGKLDWVRAGITGLGPKAFRAVAVEERLSGAAADAERIREAAAGVSEGIEANSDLYASADYRRQMAAVYTARAIAAALERAR